MTIDKKEMIILHSEIIDPTRPDEQDTLLQVETIQTALKSLGISSTTLSFSSLAQVSARLENSQDIVVFNLVESVRGKCELLNFPVSLLEYLQIPYTGNDAATLFLTTHKVLTKVMMSSLGIPTPEWHCPYPGIGHQITTFQGPWIVKPVSEEGSLGIDQESVVKDIDAMKEMLDKKEQIYGGRWFAEQFIEGREFNISMIESPNGLVILPIAEIQFKLNAGEARILSYKSKWEPDHAEFTGTVVVFPEEKDDEMLFTRLKALNQACWEGFSLKGYARVDIRVDEQGNPWILEINANPCLSPGAGLSQAASKAGLEMTTIIEWIVQSSLKNIVEDPVYV